MQIYLFQDEKQIGPFPLDAVHDMKALGSANDGTLVWHDGLADWQPIGPFLAANPSTRTTQAPVAAAPAQRAVSRAVPQASATEPSDISRVVRSLLAGGVAALIGGGIWALIAIVAHIQIGWLAWGIGWLCGLSVAKFGRGNGVVFQFIAVGFSLLGILIGKVGIAIGLDVLAISLFDILWVVLAVASAWKTAGGDE
jgi:hypothetical protein